MERTTRLLLTREAALSKANSLDISRENTWRIRFLDVRFTWEKLLPEEALCLVDGTMPAPFLHHAS
jgi:hypothetical protein